MPTTAKASWKMLNVMGMLLALTMLFTVAAHAKDDPEWAPRSTYVRVLHAIPGGPKVDIYIDSKKTLNDVTFGALTKYQRMPAGVHRASVVINEPRRVLFSANTQMRINRFYTVIAYGSKNAPRFRVLDETSGAVNPRRARLVVSHLSPGAPPVDVIARTASGRYLTLFRRLGFGQAKYILVPPGDYTVYLRSGGRVIKQIGGVELQAARRYSAFAIGKVGADGDNEFRVLLDTASSQ